MQHPTLIVIPNIGTQPAIFLSNISPVYIKSKQTGQYLAGHIPTNEQDKDWIRLSVDKVVSQDHK